MDVAYLSSSTLDIYSCQLSGGALVFGLLLEAITSFFVFLGFMKGDMAKKLALIPNVVVLDHNNRKVQARTRTRRID